MFYFILLLSWISTIEGGYPGYRFDQDINGWVKLHRVPATWKEAWLRCKLEGSTLASPTSDEMLEVMKDLMKDNGTQPCGIFTGIHQTHTKGNFYSIQGVPLSQVAAKLATSRTLCKQSLKDCLILNSGGTLSDVDCSQYYPYICHKSDASSLSCYPGYVLDNRTGSCYKFHKDGTTWSEAAKICSTEGGHLAIINSVAEVQVLKELFSNYPPPLRNTVDVIAYLGFLKWESRWVTLFGQSLDEAGYGLWRAPQPDNAGGHQNCGAFFRSGDLDDYECSNKVAFFCEATPEKYY